MKVAVIGAGVSGLSAARILARDHHVLLFEKDQRVGGHANTVVVNEGNRERPVDTGFIVFNDRTYPNFTRLLQELEVDRRLSEMSFSVRCDGTGLEYNGTSIASLFYQRRNMVSAGFMKMLFDIVRFNKTVKRQLDESRLDSELTLQDYVGVGGYGQMFQDKYLLPMVSAIWSVSVDLAMRMPIQFFARFFANHGLLDLANRPQWYTVDGGSITYTDKIASTLGKGVHTGAPIISVARDGGPRSNDSVKQKVHVTTADGNVVVVDHVFMATHSDIALSLIANPTMKEQQILSSIGYSENTAVLHQDTSLLPMRPKLWASWNYYIDQKKRELPTLTYNMDILQAEESNLRNRPWCVTLNRDPDELTDVAGVYSYSHPTFDAAAVSAQRRKNEICGIQQISYCGAYWGYGFHEDGVSSALDAVARFEENNREQGR